MSQSLMGKLQGANIGSLTSSLGGESNNMSGMGGFGNKFNQGALGAKSGFTAGVGTGFQNMPKFDQRKNKMLAMKAPARALFSKTKGANSAKVGKGAYNQAKGVRGVQKSYTGSDIDSARSTQDKAWEGTTGDGTTDATGAGLSDGGAGVVTSPSLDNASGDTQGGSTDDATTPDVSNPQDVSPWAKLLKMAMMAVLLSAVLSMIGGALIKAGNTLGAVAILIGVKVMSTYGQKLLGSVYVVGGGVAIAAAGMAMAGKSIGPITPMWMSAIAGIIGLMGSMFSSK
jgi:hypothetical protein